MKSIKNVSATRKREVRELTVIKVEHSATKDNNEVEYAVNHAIDRNIFSRSFTAVSSDGKAWLKMTLDHLNCIQRVMRNIFDGNAYESPFQTWTCTDDECNNCGGSYCSFFTLTISEIGAAPGGADIPGFTDCKIGDTIMLEKTASDPNFRINEIVIIGYEGKKLVIYIASTAPLTFFLLAGRKTLSTTSSTKLFQQKEINCRMRKRQLVQNTQTQTATWKNMVLKKL